MKGHNSLRVLFCFVILASHSSGQARAQDVTPPVPMPPQAQELIVPEGTQLPVALTTFLNTRSSQAGDSFYVELLYPVWIQQRQVIPRGTVIKGVVTQVQRPGRIKGKGRISIRFESLILPNGVQRNLVADLRSLHGPGAEKLDSQSETVEMEGSKGRDAGDVIGYSSQGAIIGAISGRGKGAGIGAGTGAAVGIISVLFTRGRELVLSPGTQFDLVLEQPLRFAFSEIEFSPQDLNRARGAVRPPSPAPNEQEKRQRRRGILPFPWPGP